MACGALVALVFVFSERARTNAAADALNPEVQRVRQQLGVLSAQDSEVREALTSEQRQTLEAAHLLVDRKRFSWSRLFADLEASLPSDVRVTQIRVRDAVERRAQTYAELELTIVSPNTTTVTNMSAEMNRGSLFAVELVAEQPLATDRGQSGTEWTLNVRYTQRQVRSTTDANGGGEEIVSSLSSTEGNGVER